MHFSSLRFKAKKASFLRTSKLAFVLLFIVFIISCSGESGGWDNEIEPIPKGYVFVDSISIDGESTVVLKAGETKTFNVTVLPSNATALGERKVFWESENRDVTWCLGLQTGGFTNNKQGKMTPTTQDSSCLNKTYTATAFIYDRSATLNMVKREAEVTVMVVDKDIAVTGVTVSPAQKTLAVGQSVQLEHAFLPKMATNRKVSWKSSDGSIAKVDSNGNVIAVANGTANITVTTADGNKTASAKLTVTQPVAVQSVSVSPAYSEVIPSTVGLLSKKQLSVQVFPAHATYDKITWSTSNPNLATVTQKGLVKFVQEQVGTVTITAKVGGKSATAQIKTLNPLVANPPPLPSNGGKFPMGKLDDKEGAITRAYELHKIEIPYALWHRVAAWAVKEENGGGYSKRMTASQGGENGSYPIVGTRLPTEEKKRQPATAMSWYEAALWCNAYTEWSNYVLRTNYTVVYRDGATLNEGNPIRDLEVMKEKLKDFNDPNSLTGTGWRLPTEAEWEYSARYMGKASNGCPSYTIQRNGHCFLKHNYISGAKTGYIDSCLPPLADGQLQCNINNNEVAVLGYEYYVVNNSGRNLLDTRQLSTVQATANIMTKKPNYLGLYNMGGNVREWVFDMHPNDINKTNLGNRKRRKIRGGSFGDAIKNATVGYCSLEGCYIDPLVPDYYEMRTIGLRPARTLP